MMMVRITITTMIRMIHIYEIHPAGWIDERIDSYLDVLPPVGLLQLLRADDELL